MTTPSDPFHKAQDADRFQSTKATNDAHIHSDVDRDRLARHHTLGVRATQASAGDHIHDGENGLKLGSFTLTGALNPATVAQADALIDQLITILKTFVNITDNRA